MRDVSCCGKSRARSSSIVPANNRRGGLFFAFRNCADMRAPVKRPKLIVTEHRVNEARQIVVRQMAVVERLCAGGEPTLDAEDSLRIWRSALEHLEALIIELRQARPKKDAKAVLKWRPYMACRCRGARFRRTYVDQWTSAAIPSGASTNA